MLKKQDLLQDLLVESFNNSENENLKRLKELYFQREKNYLEVLYFQILRNSKTDNFDEYCLLNIFSFSQYLNSRIFQVLSKNKDDLKLNEFISGVKLLFSKFLPRNGKQLTEIIFDLISNNTEYITYRLIKDFANNLLFDCFCKVQNYEYEFFILFSKNLSKLINSTFSIGSKISKFYKINRNEFLIIIEKNPLFIKILVILLNFLSPINENLICKLSQSRNIEFFNNDDFENEFVLEFDKTPRINSLPKENSLNFENFRCSDEKDSIESSNSFKNQLSFGYKNRISEFNYNLNDEDKSMDMSFQSIDLELKNYNFYKIFKNETISKNYYNIKSNNVNSPNKISYRESSQGELSTDISGMEFIMKNGNRNCKDPFLINFNNRENQSINYKNKISDSSSFLNKINYKYSDGIMKDEIIHLPSLNEIKTSNRTSKNISETNYLFTSNENEIFPSKDLRLLKSEEKDSEIIYNNIFLLSKGNKNITQKKCKKIKVLFRKANSLNLENSISKVNNNNLIDLYNTQYEDKTLPFIVKFIENDMLIYNLTSNDNSKAFKNKAVIKNSLFEAFLLQKLNYLEKDQYYIYFYNLKNIILSSLPEQKNCEFTFILGKIKFKFFCLEFTHIKQCYQLFFESYEQLVNFYNILRNKLKEINRPFFLNQHKHKCNFDLLQKIDIIFKKQQQFSVFHKLVEKNINFSMKVQTFDKNMLNTKNYLFLKKMFDTCKISNFLNLKIFSISNFYESENNFILEYTNNDNFSIKWNTNLNRFLIMIKNTEIKDILSREIIKFQKFMKLLNYKENVSILFELIDIQNPLVFNKA